MTARVRKDPREKENNEEYARQLASDFEVYVNEDFATSHRKYTSFAALPQFMKSQGREVCLGMRFEKELEMLSTVWNHEGRRILVIGGVKIDDKQKFAEDMKEKFAVVLKGGLLPGARLRPDGMDITDEAIDEYVKEIQKAEVILAAGVMGKYEDADCAKGTKAILEAIADNPHAYKVAGGGDIEMAISTYKLTEKFNWISVGGGAMLEYLARELPGLEAVSGRVADLTRSVGRSEFANAFLDYLVTPPGGGLPGSSCDTICCNSCTAAMVQRFDRHY